MTENNWRQVLPDLNEPTDGMICQLLDDASIISLEANSTVFQYGDECNNYLILLQGRIKVFTRAENGREILLYRLSQGDSCVLTTSCLFGNRNYPAEGKTETAVTALAISADRFNQALQQSAVFRELVFSAFSLHLSDLISLVEEVAFGKLDLRLAKYLLNQCDSEDTLVSTHHNIATELGSAREVISRQLKEFESKGMITINRGRIKINDRAALQDFSDNK